MADEGTASTLVLVAGILQLILSIVFFALFGVMLIPLLPFLSLFLSMPGGIFILLPVFLFIIFGLFGLILAFLWLMWRKEPSAHKGGLIVSGILGLIFAGLIPGLLALIGGAMAPSEA